MRAFLFTLLAAVAAIMLWAIRSESYQNGLVFALATLAAGLCGYLLADYFFNIEKKTLKEDVVSAGKDIQALKDEKDLLQTQFNLATPHAQVEQLEQQLSFADEQRHKLDGLTRAQYAEISALKTQLEMQKKNYQKLYEEAAIASETHSAEITNLQDTLASKREKIKYLTDEGEYLRNKLKAFETASDEGTIQKVVSEVNAPPTPNLPRMVVKMPQNGNGNGSERGILQMLDPRSMKSDTVEAEAVVETPTIEPQPIMELKPIELKSFLEKKTLGLPVVSETEQSVENRVEASPTIDFQEEIVPERNVADLVSETKIVQMPTISEAKPNGLSIVAEPKVVAMSILTETQPTVENSAVEAGATVDAPPSVSEKKLSLAEIIAEVQAGEMQERVEAKANGTESAVVAKPIESEPISPESTIEPAPVVVEKTIDAAPTAVEQTATTEQADAVATEIPQATDAHMFSFSKKIDAPKAGTTPIVSLSKSIAAPTISEVEIPTMAKSIPTVEAETLPTVSKSIPTLETSTPATFVEEISTDASNLQAIQGIDAETERVLKSAGIDTWQEVSEATPQRLNEILKEGKIRGVDVTHWSIQAVLLADGHVNRLKTFLENLKK
jgi:predicted flap endonuclease-1-like 5' DNA nuclease